MKFRIKNTLRRSPRRRSAARRGQSIVVALLVLLLLGLAGALFVTVIARNVINAAHASRTITADQYARAGITFADAQLSSSLDGADWRPPLQFALSDGTNGTTDYRPTKPRELARYGAQGLGAPSPNDPDLKYLQAGYTRYNTGAGRFLLRLTYDPVNVNYGPGNVVSPVPPGKYIKIEAIGREGVIDPVDPTTFTNNRSSDRLQAYQVAYKPIGITDYARFETNLDNRSDLANIGVTSKFLTSDTDGGIVTPGVFDMVTGSANTPSFDASGHPILQPYAVVTTYGAPDAYLDISGVLQPNPTAGMATSIDTSKALPGGGSFHANMPVRFFGENVVYLNNASQNAPLFQDSFEVAGDLLLNGYDQTQPLFSATPGPSATGQRSALILNPPDLAQIKTGSTYVAPSNDDLTRTPNNGGFDTKTGLVRDGSPKTDINGLPRSIVRLEPPLMDALDSASRLPRYKALATLSPPRLDDTGKPYPAGSSQYGYGQSIYINNPQDLQEDSKVLANGKTLVDSWLNRTSEVPAKNKGGWNGDFYEPPGVVITLGRQNVIRNGQPKLAYGARMTLFTNDGKYPAYWPNPDGSIGTDTTKTVLYDDINASNDPAKATSGNIDNDVVIYAEGNIRVHGIASADPLDKDSTLNAADSYPRHITLVTNGTAYIEGSLLKGNPDSSITVLAHDYVCVNTTQFLAGPQFDDNAIGTAPPFSTSDSLTLGQGETRLIQEFTSGLPNGGTAATAYSNLLGLYISARPGTGDPAVTQADFDIVNPATGLSVSGQPPFVAPVWSPIFDPATVVPGNPAPQNSEQQYFNLSAPLITDMSMNPATPLMQLVESDTRLLVTRRNPTTPQDVELERVAILPMDIRVEAVLYAQTGSFFVIPGFWFNNDNSDRLDSFAPTVTSPNSNGVRIKGSNPHFPFYGQPIDMKIIIDGAVSEAQPADVANQTAWMLKWGWIPQFHGYASQATPPTGAPLETAGHYLLDKNGKPASKPAIGLQIIYNPQAGYPYHPMNKMVPGDTDHYLRSDMFGRALPFSPRLPVSTGLLYAGESSEPPLLQ